MGRYDLGGEEDEGKGGVDPFFRVIEVLDPKIHFIFIIIFEFAGKEIGFICPEGEEAVFFELKAYGRILHEPEIMNGVPVDLQLIGEGGIHMQGKIRVEVTYTQGGI